MSAGGRPNGKLAILLHTHMPYVEGFGTWPFGEEWLWEAIAGCYLPLLDLLDTGAPLTVSLTPVLCDQLEAAGLGERFEAFAGEVRRHTHEEDIKGLRAGGHEVLARELERSWGDYESALESFTRREGNLLDAFAPHAQWTSSATHAVLALLASDAGVRAQTQCGIDAHRARFGSESWRGGFWLPECAYASWLEPTLADAGVHATCVELTDRFGLGSPRHLRPIANESGATLVPIDRATMELVWSERGYPANGIYRDYHNHTVHHHNPWANNGEAYDHDRACALAREHAADFVARTLARVRHDGEGLPGGGLVVCALDTELLGHWWYEGIVWLAAVVEECTRQGLELVRLDDALEQLEPVADDGFLEAAVAGERARPDVGAEPQAISWGANGDLSTWSGPAVADMAFTARADELRVLAAGEKANQAALRELLALQASDWAFMISRELAAPYAHERFEGHHRALELALSEGPGANEQGLRNLAINAHEDTLFAP
jgi:1,4-alpha-glucan branching enzyme